MDKETEIRRKINYVNDLIQKSDDVIKGESNDDYYEYYRTYREVVVYLNSSTENNSNPIPELIKPNIFNKRLGGLWTITVLGLLNPFFAILIFTITFPITFPYLITRGLFLTQTKNRVEELKICLTTIVNNLKTERIEMTLPLVGVFADQKLNDSK
ncbi:MAG: hypothetical protein JSS79_10890 [Bacteroidetes bacterium]|nr:hypothetical protein [Bacteroidota bacterium]